MAENLLKKTIQPSGTGEPKYKRYLSSPDDPFHVLDLVDSPPLHNGRYVLIVGWWMAVGFGRESVVLSCLSGEII
jgi:hypothetical protein